MITIETNWDFWNTTLLVSKLMRHAEKGEFFFTLDVIENKRTLEIKPQIMKKEEIIALLKKYFSRRVHVSRRLGLDIKKPAISLDGQVLDYKIEYDSTLNE